MSRRPSSPPLERAGYLESLGGSGGFRSVRAESTDGYGDGDGTWTASDEQHLAQQHYQSARPAFAPSHAAPPSYATGNAAQSSSRGPRPLSASAAPSPSPSPSGYPSVNPFPIHANPFARPDEPASEAEFHWGDDAASTIRPDDSVSQLDRRFTGKRGLTGPRAIPARNSFAAAPMPEDDTASFAWVDPAALALDDADTIVGPTGRTVPQSTLEVTPVQQYYPEEEDEVAPYHSSAPMMNRGSSSSAALPLVTAAAPIAGYPDAGSAVQPYQGYAAVGRADESEDEYGAYSRAHDPDLERAVRGDGTAVSQEQQQQHDSGGIRQVGAATFASALSYVKSMRGTPSSMNKGQFDRQENEYDDDSYPPQPRSKGFGDVDDQQPRDVEGMRPAPTIQRLLYDTTPNELRIHEHKRGLGIQQRPWACWVLSLIMIGVMIYELVHMSQLTGSPIQTKPSFNGTPLSDSPVCSRS